MSLLTSLRLPTCTLSVPIFNESINGAAKSSIAPSKYFPLCLTKAFFVAWIVTGRIRRKEERVMNDGVDYFGSGFLSSLFMSQIQ